MASVELSMKKSFITLRHGQLGISISAFSQDIFRFFEFLIVMAIYGADGNEKVYNNR